MSVPNQREQLMVRDKACEANAFAAAPNAFEELSRFAGNQAFSLAYDDEVLGYPILDFEECLDQAAEVFVRLDVSDINEVGPRMYTRQLSGSIPFVGDTKVRGNDVVFAWPCGQTEKLGLAEVRHGKSD